MNTPAHILLNLLCLERNRSAKLVTAVAIGGVLPDAPMFIGTIGTLYGAYFVYMFPVWA